MGSKDQGEQKLPNFYFEELQNEGWIETRAFMPDSNNEVVSISIADLIVFKKTPRNPIYTVKEVSDELQQAVLVYNLRSYNRKTIKYGDSIFILHRQAKASS